MSWKNILKRDELHTITNELINPLEDYINSNWTPDGEYDEEKDGYYNADNQSDLYISYPDVKIRIEPDEDTDGLVREMNLYFKDTRLGSFTGNSGLYLATDEWKDYNLDDLKELLGALTAGERPINTKSFRMEHDLGEFAEDHSGDYTDEPPDFSQY